MWTVIITISLLFVAPEVNSQKSVQPMGCSDPRPFQMNYSNWWRCDHDAIDCFDTVVVAVLKNVHGKSCKNDTCLAITPPNHGDSLRKYLNNSISKQEQAPPTNGECPWVKWTAEMDFTANLIIQKSQRCQVDYVAIFVLFDATQRLLGSEKRCLAAGMSIPSSGKENNKAVLQNLVDKNQKTAAHHPKKPSQSNTNNARPTSTALTRSQTRTGHPIVRT